MLRRIFSFFGSKLPISTSSTATTKISPSARVDLALATLARAENNSRIRVAAAEKEDDEKAAGSSTSTGEAISPTAREVNHQKIARAHHDPLLIQRLTHTDEHIYTIETSTGLCELAGALFAGVKIPKNVNRAGTFWLAAAKQGHAGALLAVALASVNGLGPISKAPLRARGMLGLLADREKLPPAQYALALLLSDDAQVSIPSRATSESKISQNAIRALALFRAAADSGQCPPARLNTANCLFFGVGTSAGLPDFTTAAVYLEDAAKGGDASAAAELSARILRNEIPGGVGVASKWTRAAAEAGHPVAMYNEGIAALGGGGGGGDVRRDPIAARVWFERSADAGYFRAAVNLGLLLARGSPPLLQKNTKEAALRLRSAAILGRNASVRATEQGRPPPISLMRTLELIDARVAALESGGGGGGEDDDVGGGVVEGEGELEIDFETTEARDAALDAIAGAAPGEEGAKALQQVLIQAAQKST